MTLLEAARAVVQRWDTPSWKWEIHTAEFIQALRAAIAAEEAKNEDGTHCERCGPMVAACCGRYDCGGECGNQWQGMRPSEPSYDELMEQVTAYGSALQAAEAELDELRAKLAAVESAEPVAWLCDDTMAGVTKWKKNADAAAAKGMKVTPLYTHPAPLPAYTPMTDEMQEVLALLARYRKETPLGHQPHMIAHEADEVLARLGVKHE